MSEYAVSWYAHARLYAEVAIGTQICGLGFVVMRLPHAVSLRASVLWLRFTIGYRPRNTRPERRRGVRAAKRDGCAFGTRLADIPDTQV
jgi:hypothetical protein